MKLSIANKLKRAGAIGCAVRFGLCGLLTTGALCAAAQARFTYSAEGSEVTDSRTGLVWKRCVEGMVWSGATCTGSASLFGQEQALAHAKSLGIWRVPNVKELASIVDRGRQKPAADQLAFPATPSSIVWTSTPVIGNSSNAWLVDFDQGGVAPYLRLASLPVRLVRVAP